MGRFEGEGRCQAIKLRCHFMGRIAKLFAYFLALLLALPVVMFAAYDLLVFQPYKADIRHLLDRAAADERAPGPIVVGAARASLSQHISAHTSRLLMDQINAVRSPDRALQGMLHNSLWWALVALHLSDQEQNTLFLSLAHLGAKEAGFSAASRAMFHAPLNALSIEQAATLAAVSKSPYYLKNPERLARARAAIMLRMQAREVSP
jgi:hypothetical protein